MVDYTIDILDYWQKRFPEVSVRRIVNELGTVGEEYVLDCEELYLAIQAEINRQKEKELEELVKC